MAPAIMWFRRDLRIRDNSALTAAAAGGRPVIPVYVSDSLDAGGASRWWLHHSLGHLDKTLRNHGSGLVIRAGDPATELSRHRPDRRAPPTSIAVRGTSLSLAPRLTRCEKRSVRPHSISEHHDSTLHHPDTVMTLAGKPFKVFTPFWKAASGRGDPRSPLPAPPDLTTATQGIHSLRIRELDLLPRMPDWAGGLRETWVPGESGALARLESAAERAAVYAEERDRPDLDTTSRMSPHLHFGEVSPRQMWHDVTSANMGASASGRAGVVAAALLARVQRLPALSLPSTFPKNRYALNSSGSRGWTMRPGCGTGSEDRPGTRSSTRACGNSGLPAGCITACE